MLKNPINTFLASGSTQLCTGSDVGRSNAAFGRVSQPNETPQAEDIRLCYKYSLRRCRSQHRPIRLQAGTTLVVTYLRASSHPSRENSHPSRENALYTHTYCEAAMFQTEYLQGSRLQWNSKIFVFPNFLSPGVCAH